MLQAKENEMQGGVGRTRDGAARLRFGGRFAAADPTACMSSWHSSTTKMVIHGFSLNPRGGLKLLWLKLHCCLGELHPPLESERAPLGFNRSAYYCYSAVLSTHRSTARLLLVASRTLSARSVRLQKPWSQLAK